MLYAAREPSARHARAFGLSGYARFSWGQQLMGRRRHVPLCINRKLETFATVDPCGMSHWICACLKAKYKDDPRHDEYSRVWIEMQSGIQQVCAR